jgi:transcription initiation factor TFIID subunit 5
LDDDSAAEKTPNEEVQWAAPVPPAARLAEAGEEIPANEAVRLPFPRLHLDTEFDTKADADQAKKVVEFNRALLVNGFRRLEALERKREYEIEGHRGDEKIKDEARSLANPLKPSILQYTLCSSSSPGPVLSSGSRIGSTDASSIWDEPGIGVTCAKMCYPDGRRVAAGCDDAAVRIWSMYDSKASDKDGTKRKDQDVSETGIVLLGHKNGFPVFDVDWNRDGRTLLSAGGDGSVRLWDTMAVGPYGTTTKATRQTAQQPSGTGAKEQEELVPGLRPESSVDASGAALAVYRGHSPSCPIWSVAFAPSGYYFATAASDATARIWTTDRSMPVRILSGHISSSVNTVTWHPNCNYVLTGCDDKTVRMWDVQNGRCARLLTGCGTGISVVRVCPSGRYAAGADYSGIIHIWDLASGKKVNELRPPSSTKRDASGLFRVSAPTIHSLSYSACGTALAAGGDDCTVRVWDVRGAAKVERPGLKTPSQSFPTKQTSILDLQFTKRNLLMSLGKYTTPVPLAVPVTIK